MLTTVIDIQFTRISQLSVIPTKSWAYKRKVYFGSPFQSLVLAYGFGGLFALWFWRFGPWLVIPIGLKLAHGRQNLLCHGWKANKRKKAGVSPSHPRVCSQLPGVFTSPHLLKILPHQIVPGYSQALGLTISFNVERQTGSKVQGWPCDTHTTHYRWVDGWRLDDPQCQESWILTSEQLIMHGVGQGFFSFCHSWPVFAWETFMWIWVSGYRKQVFTDSKSERIFIVKEVLGAHIILPVNNDERKFIF